MNIGALIIAAGSTSRRDSFAPMQKIGSISAIQRLIMTFHLADVQPIVIVVSAQDRPMLEKHTSRTGVVLMQSKAPDAEMFENVCLGLTYLQTICDKVLLTPVDIPLFSVDTVKTLIQSGELLVSPICQGRGGHPLVIDRQVIPAIIGYTGADGLHGAMGECGFVRRQLEIADPGVFVRSDQFTECEKIAVNHNQKQWRPVMKLQIAKESAFLGPGSWQLLSLIETTGSVRFASQQMGISYSKAWKILNNLEEQVGYSVLSRQPGGKNGGKTHLTKQGKQLLEQFERFERECNNAVNQLFQKHFGGD